MLRSAGTRTLTAVFAHALPSSPIQTPFGELLLDPSSPRVLLSFSVPSGGVSVHPVSIPADPDLIGKRATVQGARFGAGTELTLNALDLLLGL